MHAQPARSRGVRIVTLPTTLALALTLSLSGCGDSRSLEQITIDDAEEQVAPVAEALEQPTGDVSADEVEDILDALRGEAVAVEAQAQGSGAGAGAGGPCMTQDEHGGTVDMACATGGRVTGTVSWRAVTRDGTTWFTWTYDNVCDGHTCISGTGAQRTTTKGGVTVIVTGDFTITEDGKTRRIRYGMRSSIGQGGIELSYVVWVDGKSYVVTYTLTDGRWRMTVRGADGEYVCEATREEDGWAGSCQGEQQFQF